MPFGRYAGKSANAMGLFAGGMQRAARGTRSVAKASGGANELDKALSAAVSHQWAQRQAELRRAHQFKKFMG